jgi:hypothetical protein
MPPSYEDFFLVINGRSGAYTVEAQGPGEVRVSPLPFEYQETHEWLRHRTATGQVHHASVRGNHLASWSIVRNSSASSYAHHPGL